MVMQPLHLQRAEQRFAAGIDPAVAKRWKGDRISEDYTRLAASWRAQNPLWAAAHVAREKLKPEEIADMEREMVASSTILSAGYEAA